MCDCCDRCARTFCFSCLPFFLFSVSWIFFQVLHLVWEFLFCSEINVLVSGGVAPKRCGVDEDSNQSLFQFLHGLGTSDVLKSKFSFPEMQFPEECVPLEARLCLKAVLAVVLNACGVLA